MGLTPFSSFLYRIFIRASDSFTPHQLPRLSSSKPTWAGVARARFAPLSPPGRWCHGDCNDIICMLGGKSSPTHLQPWGGEGVIKASVWGVLQRLCPSSAQPHYSPDTGFWAARWTKPRTAVVAEILNTTNDKPSASTRYLEVVVASLLPMAPDSHPEGWRLEVSSGHHLVQEGISALVEIFVLLHSLQTVWGMLTPSCLALFIRFLGKMGYEIY